MTQGVASPPPQKRANGDRVDVGSRVDLACQSLLAVLIDFGFLVFGVTDHACKPATARYVAVTAREPGDDGRQTACKLPADRLAKWVAVFCDGRKDQPP